MNKKMSYMLIGLILLFITTITFAYAYFSRTINGEGKNITISTGTLSVSYKGGQEVILNNAYPGDSITKTFTVQNDGNLETEFNLFYDDLLNTFLKDELVITYTCTSYKNYVDENNKGQVSGTCEGLEETSVPYSGVITNSYILTEKILIPSNITYEYNIKITFKEMGINQNYNIGKKFNTKISVGTLDNKDIKIALLLNGETIRELPSEDYYKLASYECDNGSIITWDTKRRRFNVDGEKADNCVLNFTEADTLIATLLRDNPNIKNDSADLFINAADEESESGLFRTTDLTKTEDFNADGVGEEVLYFRGVVENNYLMFAGYCWRIIRTNESGKSIRLRYGGEPITTNGTTICPQTGTQVYLSSKSFDKITTETETWFTNYIESQGTNITNLIIDEPFCYDKEHTSTSSAGTTAAVSHYGAYDRILSGTPQYKCPSIERKYSVNSTIGNGELSKPIGILNADEVVYAGARTNGSNLNLYLNIGEKYWIESSYTKAYGEDTTTRASIDEDGKIYYRRSDQPEYIVPVISISNEAIVGDNTTGTYYNPYVIVNE